MRPFSLIAFDLGADFKCSSLLSIYVYIFLIDVCLATHTCIHIYMCILCMRAQTHAYNEHPISPGIC